MQALPATTPSQLLAPRTHRRCSSRPLPPAAAAVSAGEQLQGVLVCKRVRKQLVRSIRKATQPRFSTGTADALPALINDLRRIQLHTAQGCDIMPAVLPPSHSRSSYAPAAAAVQLAPATTRPSLTVALPAGWEDELAEDEPVYQARAYEVPGRVLVCQGSKCRAKGALGVLQAVSAVTSGSDAVQVLPCKCLGLCKQGPAMRVKQEGVAKCAVYTHLEPSQVPELLDAHFAAPAALQQQHQQHAGHKQEAACCADCKQSS